MTYEVLHLVLGGRYKRGQPHRLPPWRTGDDHLPDFPEDGCWHYGEPGTITVIHGSCETIDPGLEITL